jgi:hypothetical protein
MLGVPTVLHSSAHTKVLYRRPTSAACSHLFLYKGTSPLKALIPQGASSGSRDQADAEWIVIRTQLWGHNDMPFGRPAPSQSSGRPESGRPSGVFCMF